MTEFADTKERGLSLRVTPQGVKSWTFRYRTAANEQKRISLGRLDDVSLAAARAAVVAERARVHAGQDPAAVRKAAKQEAIETSRLETVAEVGIRYFSEAAAGRHRPNARQKRQSTLKSERYYFDRHVLPRLGKEKLSDLTRARVQALVNAVADEHAPSTARQCKVVLHGIYSFGIWQEIVVLNPCQFVTVPQFQTRERVLTDGELGVLWRALRDVQKADGVYVSHSVSVAILLAAVTLQRRAEITGMRRSEIDREARLWIIPGKRTKNHRTHIVPLSPLAIELIDEAEALAGGSQYVFPSPRKTDEPIGPSALSHAFRRVTAKAGLVGIRPHDLRRTGATALTSERLSVSRFLVSRVLNHASDTGDTASVTGIYDRNSYLPEKRRALEAWAGELNRITSCPASNVVTIR
ncbi:site-specific integrase [Aurantimonas sp. HBX-1]|nr:site-specific integrase [Aurantimonas sp. HBX-1]